MFEYFQGQIVEKGPTRVILDVGGVGYAFTVPLSTAEALPREGSARLLAYLHVREDAQKLFGFAQEAERQLFMLLTRVSGIGPTLAVAILSRASVADLCQAIEEGRIDFLKSLKGVGPKTASRLVTELNDKVSQISAGPGLAPMPTASRLSEDAIAALEVLGCPPKQARRAVATILKEHPNTEVEVLVRQALRLVWPT